MLLFWLFGVCVTREVLEFREAIRLVDKENNKYFYFQFVYCSTRLYIRYDLCLNTGPADRMIPYRIGPVLTPNLISSCPSPLVDSRVCAPLYLIQRTCRRYSNTDVQDLTKCETGKAVSECN